MSRESRAAHALRVTAEAQQRKANFAKLRAKERAAQAAEVKRRESGGRNRRNDDDQS